jgi:thiol-disulfide isomerase/thioredoxin
VPAFRFTTPSGKQVTPAAYEGKVLVLDFWATWCGPCRMSLPNLEKVRQQYQENDNVAFLAVSVDQPDTPDAKLRSTFDELKVDIPMARDIEQQSGNLFKFNSIPIMFIVGPKGLVQYFETGGNPQLAAILPEKIDKLLAGEDIYEEPLEQYEKQLEQFANPEAAMQQESEIPQADVAPKSEPEKLALAPLWQAEGLSGPGNIVVVPDKSGAARLLVVSDWKSVAEVGPDGKVVATYPLQLPEQEVVSFLRTATTPDGKRIFAGSAPGMLQLYAFDEKFNPLFVYPEAAMENPHSGITDVQIADLDGDGTPMLAVGYRGDVGVQGVSIEGERIWSNRSVPIVLRLAVGAPDAEGKRTLLCANGSEGLAALNAEGKTQGEINVPGRMLYWIAAEDLNGDGKAEYCALSATNLGKMSALGIDLEGNELWSYDLPEGVHTQPIEPVTAGQLSADGPGVWILAAADGSLHFLGADGSVLDRFNYGKELSGVATATIQGQAALLVSTPEQLEAWKIQSAP